MRNHRIVLEAQSVTAGIQREVEVVARKAHVGAEIGEHALTADVQALVKIGAINTLLEGFADARLLGKFGGLEREA